MTEHADHTSLAPYRRVQHGVDSVRSEVRFGKLRGPKVGMGVVGGDGVFFSCDGLKIGWIVFCVQREAGAVSAGSPFEEVQQREG